MKEVPKKPRSDAKLHLLPEDQQEKIWDWLKEEGGSYSATVDKCWMDLSVRTSISSLRRFRVWYVVKLRYLTANTTAVQMVDLMKEKDPSLSPKALREYGDSIFTAESIETQDPKTYIALETLRLARESAQTKARLEVAKLKLSKRRLRVMETKMNEAKDKLTKVISKGGLTPETLAEIQEAAKIL